MKTFYTVQHVHSKNFRTLDARYWTANLSEAAQRISPADCVDLLLQWRSEFAQNFSHLVQIVRVEVTPGASKLVVTNRTKIDATKPCVLVDDDDETYHTTDTRVGWSSDLQKATVFDDLQEVLRVIHKTDTGTYARSRRLNCEGNLKVFNVEIQKTDETYTVTVLK